MTFSAYLRANIGSNWVIAACVTNRLRSRYGSDVRAISKKRYARFRADYRLAHGDPEDPVRAELYLCLRVAKNALGIATPAVLVERIERALDAEASAK